MRANNLAFALIAVALAGAALLTRWHAGAALMAASPSPTPTPTSASSAVFHWRYGLVKMPLREYDFTIHGTSTDARWTATIEQDKVRIVSGTVSLVQYSQFLDGLVQHHIWTVRDNSQDPHVPDCLPQDLTLQFGGHSRHLALLYSTIGGQEQSQRELLDYLDSSLASQPLRP